VVNTRLVVERYELWVGADGGLDDGAIVVAAPPHYSLASLPWPIGSRGGKILLATNGREVYACDRAGEQRRGQGALV